MGSSILPGYKLGFGHSEPTLRKISKMLRETHRGWNL
jgi:hypothetical protein